MSWVGPLRQQKQQRSAVLHSAVTDCMFGCWPTSAHGRTRGFVYERRKGPADLQQIREVADAMTVEATPAAAAAAACESAAAKGVRSSPTSLLLLLCSSGRTAMCAVRAMCRCAGTAGCVVGEAAG